MAELASDGSSGGRAKRTCCDGPAPGVSTALAAAAAGVLAAVEAVGLRLRLPERVLGMFEYLCRLGQVSASALCSPPQLRQQGGCGHSEP